MNTGSDCSEALAKQLESLTNQVKSLAKDFKAFKAKANQ